MTPATAAWPGTGPAAGAGTVAGPGRAGTGGRAWRGAGGRGGAEVVRVHVQGFAVVQQVAFGQAGVAAFPAADHRVEAFVGGQFVPGGGGGAAELAGHFWHVPAAGLPLCPEPSAEFGGHQLHLSARGPAAPGGAGVVFGFARGCPPGRARGDTPGMVVS